MKNNLWLASWYPNKISPYNGDFIQRHAESAALYQKIYVIFVVKDEHALVTNRLTVEQFTRGNLTETIAYYKPFKSGIKVIDRALSILIYLSVFKKLIFTFIRRYDKPLFTHVHVSMWAGVLALWLKKRFHIPFIVTEHWTGYDKNAGENIYNKGWIFRFLNRRVLKYADLLLPVSQQLGNLIQENFSPVKFQVVPNVVNTRYFFPANYNSNLLRFIHVSSMNQQKNVEGLLRSFSRVLTFNKNWKLIMVGPASSDLKNIARRLALENYIEWTGEIPYNEVAVAMAASSVLIMFSKSENLPCVILEALCTGLPVISTDVGGISEVITTDNGILVHSDNESQLLQAIIYMLANYGAYDSNKISKDAQARYNYDAVGKTFSLLYGAYHPTR